MPKYQEFTKNGLPYVQFRQSKTPRMLFVLLGQLDVYIRLTQSHLYPYEVQMSIGEFESCLELAQDYTL